MTNGDNAGHAPSRDEKLDTVLAAVRTAVDDHAMSVEEAASLRELKLRLRIQPGDFYRHRRDEVATILRQEVRRILEDDAVDHAEALYQDELQRVFDLGYDELLELTRDAVRPVIERAIAVVAADGRVDPDERAWFDRRIAALQTVYVLSGEQRRALGLG